MRDRETDRQTDRQETYRDINLRILRMNFRQLVSINDRDRQPDRQTDKQTETETQEH